MQPVKIDTIIAAPRATFTLSSMAIERGTTIEQWLEMGTKLRVMNKSLMWWLGDWLNFGERAYGEKYTQALESTGYDYGVLRNASWVAQHVTLSLRSDSLSWYHHKEVAPIKDTKAQAKWLKLALDGGLSVSELRMEIRRASASCGERSGEGGAQWTITKGLNEITRWFEAEIAKQPIDDWPAARREALAGDLLPLVGYREALLGKLGDS